MTHPLQQKLATLRHRVRWLALLYGLSVASAAILGTLIALGLLDYLLRFQDRGLRLMASLLMLGVFGWAFYRYLVTTLLMPAGDIDLARRLQSRFPGLGDRLISAVEFLRQAEDDPRAGSVVLRRAVVAQAAAESERLDFSEVLDRRPTARAATVLILACLAAGSLVVLDPLAAQIAVARLANPLANTAWPQTSHLAIRRPIERVARGGTFQIEVIDAFGARLPPDLQIHYRFQGPDQRTIKEIEQMRPVDRAITARRENVVRPFSYRIEGGDDRSMPWRDVDVVEPPAVKSVSAILTPPAYSGWPPSSVGQHIRALAGTSAQITGQATKPLRAASFCVEGERKVPARLSDDGCTFTVDFTVAKSGAYWFELVDRQGLGGGSEDRWEIHVIPDSPPTVKVEQPTAGLFVTPRAVALVRVAASDELALRDITLVFRRTEKGPEETVPLWASEAAPHQATSPLLPGEGQGVRASGAPDSPLALGEGQGVRAAARRDQRVIDYRWDLGPLGLTPGTQVTFHAAASDYLSQAGRSDPRSLTVVTEDELLDRIAGRGKLILAELERVLKIERGCHGQVQSLIARLDKLRQVGQAEVDQLQSVQYNQREAEQVLTSRGEGLPLHILGLLAELKNNRLQRSDTFRQATALLDATERLGREHLPTIGRELTAAVKTAQVALEGQGRGASPRQQASASLAAACKHQDAVIAALEQMIGQVSRWDSYGRFSREIGQLIKQQEDVAHRTAEVGRRTLTHQLRDLSPPDAAELGRVADQQVETARLMEQLLQQMDRAGGEARPGDSAANSLTNALNHARRSGLSGQMRTAGQQIQQNQIGRAVSGQKQISRRLQEVLDLLAAGDGQASAASQSISPLPLGEGQGVRGTGQQPAARGTEGASPGSPAGQKRRPDPAEMRKMMSRLWGQLPEHAREQMLQAPVEQFPPKYESLIEEYFRRLSENDK